MPNWLAGENSGTLILVGFFAMIVLTILGLRVWLTNNANKNESGISYDSKVNMKEFLIAVLVDNPKNERTKGLTDNDIIELYEQSTEVAAF